MLLTLLTVAVAVLCRYTLVCTGHTSVPLSTHTVHTITCCVCVSGGWPLYARVHLGTHYRPKFSTLCYALAAPRQPY
jgi:hypothetical protein